jgi:hypothetical protein
MTRKKYLFALFIPLCCAMAGLLIYGQIANQDAPATSTQVGRELSDRFLYRYFLMHLKHLDDKARNPERKQGEETLREHYKRKLRLSEDEYQNLLAIAYELEADMNNHLQRRKDAIARHKAAYPEGRLSSRDQIPPLPDELSALQAEYEEILSRYRDRARGAFAPARSIDVETILKVEFEPKMNIRRVEVPRVKDPNQTKVPPFEK